MVRYWTSSEARKLKFAECASSLGVDCSRGLWLDCPTRWNSTFSMIERALIYRDVFSRVARLDNSTAITTLTEDEWSKLKKICDLLSPFDIITKHFSGRNYPTANLYLTHVFTIESLIVRYCNDVDGTLRDMAKGMKTKFDKYWETYSVILSVAAIFDPRLKLQYVKFCFTELDPESAEYKTKQVKDVLYKLYEEYSGAENFSNGGYGANNIAPSGNNHLAAFSSFDNSYSEVNSQLDDYLAEQKMNPMLNLDVLGWWKDNEKRFKQVAKMARDLLSIPITTVASESTFSLGSRILTKWRASLLPESAETLVTTRSWLYGYDVEKDNNSLEDGVQIPIHLVPNRETQVIELDGNEENDNFLLNEEQF